jgi:hypothetical protein
MEIISKKEAKDLGLNRYFTGKPCKHGHLSERYMCNGCVSCLSDRIVPVLYFEYGIH